MYRWSQKLTPCDLEHTRTVWSDIALEMKEPGFERLKGFAVQRPPPGWLFQPAGRASSIGILRKAYATEEAAGLDGGAASKSGPVEGWRECRFWHCPLRSFHPWHGRFRVFAPVPVDACFQQGTGVLVKDGKGHSFRILRACLFHQTFNHGVETQWNQNSCLCCMGSVR